MKTEIVFLQGGLGNQMFQYAFYLVKKERGKNVICDGTMLQISTQHNGFELESLFGIQDVVCCTNKLFLRILYKFIVNRDFKWKEIVLKCLALCDLCLVIDSVPSVYRGDFLNCKNKSYYFGYWQSEKYFIHIRELVLSTFQFDESKLSPRTLGMREQIEYENSVSLHVRRGDYLTEQNSKLYGGICTVSYYEKAIDLLQKKTTNAVFYVFSNDVDWVKANLQIPNAIFVDWNMGKDSWQDMYLMSKCKHNIIANSTFSWWGAWLNTNPDKIIVSPSKFINSFRPSDIIPDSWIIL